MKKTIINLLIATIVILCCAPSNSFSQIREHSFKKREIPGYVPRDTVHQNQLKYFFEIDTVQHVSADGIKFSIKFKNTGVDIDSILNFTSYLRINLLNSSKKNIFYRDRPAFGAYKSSIAFVIDAVKVNNKKVDVILDDINVSPASPVYVVIPPKGSYEIFCRIVKVLKDDPTPYKANQLVATPPIMGIAIPGSIPYTADQLVAIPPGIYQIYVGFSVVHYSFKYDYKNGGTPVGHSAVLDSLMITYGQ